MSVTREMPSTSGRSLAAAYRRALNLAGSIPLSLVQLAGRVAVAHVFWQSAQTKLASWPVTLQLFAFEYNLPLIDPALAAPLATAAEIIGAALLFLGLFSRLGTLILLGVVAVIQIFVYPGHWGEHLMWSSLLLLILARGAGVVSLDYLVDGYFRRGA
ncbi:MAG: DoxX family protein [Mesorhizobium sp.]|nr:MAG: DoxX family protein [Mesorhizobium sp.]RWH87228.1 MAG: DoxX family protein [Mesorhizobium sp.]RWH93229.1 MAG: DoxX family protein [Mesorhizobium sp.]RWH98902.1 MAG: DoxX family protein [Mesorhizobium sp.]RWI02551.1 MAG: DoxX family protein [Mesorhizobium sp.]